MAHKAYLIRVLAGSFLIVAPLSLATEWDVSPQLKLIRITICLLGALVALSSGALERLGPASKSLLAFAGVYVFAATWSNYPLHGLAYKMLFLSSFCMGLGFVTAFPNKRSLTMSLRFLSVVATAAAIITWYTYLRSPTENLRLGRLSIHGINANSVALTAAGYLFLTVYSALNDKGLWKWLNIGSTGILIVLLVSTGSRGGIALGILGSALQLVPWLRRPVQLLVPTFAAATILLVLSVNIPVEAVERITDFEKNTRSGMWQVGIHLFLQEPVIGHGWLSGSGRSTGNLQNVYFQILAETGVLGGSIFVFSLIMTYVAAKKSYTRLSPQELPQYWLAVAILAGLAVHGVAESAVVLGTTVLTFFAGFGLGVLESISRGFHTSLAKPVKKFSHDFAVSKY